jgi:class 3 adenylate cyclase
MGETASVQTAGPGIPSTQYAPVGDELVAYQAWGSGPVDLIACRPFEAPVDLLWHEPRVARTLERLGSFARNIWFDARGSGSSSPTLFAGPEIWLDDLDAVMAAAGSEQGAILGLQDGGTGALLYAATFPERVSALILVNSHARFVRADDYPMGMPPDIVERYCETIRSNWATKAFIEFCAPSMVDDDRWSQWWMQSQRLTTTPDLGVAGWRRVIDTNVYHVLPSIQAPTLVLHRRGNRHVRVDHGRYLAEHIPDAVYRELDGDDHLFLAGATDELIDEIEEFLTGVRPPASTDRVLATVLFTDIVASSERASTLGDERWRKLLDAHDAVVRSQLERFRGREINTTGDGFVATFDGPARAIRCATEITRTVQGLGMEVRAGLHTGEVELRGDDIGGISVHTAARVQALARPGEVLVSRTVKDLVAGSGIEFADRGDHELKGVPDTWRLYVVER